MAQNNKIIQSKEKCSVRSKVGNHLPDYNPHLNFILKDEIEDIKETGLLRLEITFYSHKNKGNFIQILQR